MRKILTALTALLVATTAVEAKTATWRTMRYWHVYGATDTGICMATSIYPNRGKDLSIIITIEGEWRFMVGGVSAVPGETYLAPLTTDTGAFDILRGVAVDNETVLFGNITAKGIRALGAAGQIELAPLGVFNMKGSAAAANEVWNCHQAMKGF